MSWPFNPRPAKSLLILRDQYNTKYPSRSKDSDGMLGDELHAARVSDHNPNAQGVVTALDITHDPAHGLDIAVESQRLVLNNDPRIKYVIANKRIWEPGKGWQAYSGTDPHTNHMHVSVNASNGDLTMPWNIEEEDMERIKELEGMADDRLRVIKRLADAVDVDYKSENDIPQVLANIATLYGLVNAKDGTITKLIQNESSDAELGRKVRELLTKEVIGG